MKLINCERKGNFDDMCWSNSYDVCSTDYEGLTKSTILNCSSGPPVSLLKHNDTNDVFRLV